MSAQNCDNCGESMQSWHVIDNNKGNTTRKINYPLYSWVCHYCYFDIDKCVEITNGYFREI